LQVYDTERPLTALSCHVECHIVCVQPLSLLLDSVDIIPPVVNARYVNLSYTACSMSCKCLITVDIWFTVLLQGSSC